MKHFSFDSKFGRIMVKLCYACFLNLLWMVCSLPIITIGASTTALYYACLKIVREEDFSAASLFFRSFKQNFKQATVLWLIMLAAGIFLAGDGYILWHLRANSSGAPAVFWTLLLAIIIAAAVIYVIVLLYLFPLLASVDNTNLAMLKNSFLIGTHYLFSTILMFAVHFAMFWLIVSVFTPLFFFGEGLCALICSWLLNNVLRSVTKTPDDQRQVLDNEM
ncbi:MAG: YesL family protein [Anaerolineaceae bacterium]|nr:YesL family protein [Anaerolineaceae bacterium]